MADQRLPTVNGDDGNWGTILNQYLEKEHYNTGADNNANGGHKNITIRPGTTSTGGAPLKFTSGNLLTNPEPGAMEFLVDHLYITQADNTRKKIAAFNDTGGAQGDMYYRDVSGSLVRLPIGTNGDALTISSGTPTWGVAGGSGRSSLELMYNSAYNTSYSEVANNANGDPQTVGVWENNLKITKFFTKDIYYTDGDVSRVVITNNISGEMVTITIGYIGDDVTVTKLYSQI